MPTGTIVPQSQSGQIRTRFTRDQKVVVALLLSMNVLNYLDRNALSVVAPVMRHDLGLSTTDYALAVNAFLAAYAVMYTGSGLVMDRIGYRAGLALFVGAWSLVAGLHAAVVGLTSLAILRMLLGLAEPGGFTGAVKTVAVQFDPAQRPLATGIFTAGSGIGSLIAPPLITVLTLQMGWRQAFLIPGLAGLLLVPLWLKASRASTRKAAPKTDPLAIFRTGLWRSPRLAAYVLTRFFGDSSGYFFLFWMPEYLVSSKHFSFTMVGSLGWIPPCFTDIGAIGGGWLSGRLVQAGLGAVLSRKIMMTGAAVLVLLGTALQARAELWITLVSLSLCTMGVGVWAANLHSLPADAFDSSIAATVHGVAGTAGALGGMLFNSVVGRLAASSNYAAIFMLLAALQPLGCTALWLWMKGRRTT